MNKAFIICHGDLAEGLLSGVKAIFGETDKFIACSNKTKSIPELLHEVKGIIADYSISEPVFFVDLRGGSCWRTAMQIVKELKSGIVFSGTNLPMLVTYLSKSEECSSLIELKETILSQTSKTFFGET